MITLRIGRTLHPVASLAEASALWNQVILPRFRGRLDYAARTATRALNSYSIGLR